MKEAFNEASRNNSIKNYSEKIVRTSFPEATLKILDTLASKENMCTISSLGLETKLNRKTVEKAVGLLAEIQKRLEGLHLEIENLNRMRAIRLKKIGMLDLPEDTQRRILRSAYFPEPTEELRAIANLYLHGAVSPEKAISLNQTSVLKKFVRQGQVIRKERKFYLSEEGIIVAKGSLDIYPEFARAPKTKNL